MALTDSVITALGFGKTADRAYHQVVSQNGRELVSVASSVLRTPEELLRDLAPLVDRPLAQACVATYLHPPWIGTEVAAAFDRFAARAATLRMLGSGTMDAMAVADGRVHLVCQHTVPPWDWMPGAAVVRALGGEVRHVEAAGRTWYLAGVPTAVAEAADLLADR